MQKHNGLRRDRRNASLNFSFRYELIRKIFATLSGYNRQSRRLQHIFASPDFENATSQIFSSAVFRYTSNTLFVSHTNRVPTLMHDAPTTFSVDAILGGDTDQLNALLRQLFTAEPAADPAVALTDLFWTQWQRHCGLHSAVLIALEPLRVLLAPLLPEWVSQPAHPVWSLFATLQQVGVGYQPELGRAGEKLLADLQCWPALVAEQGWAAAARATAAQWEQEQNRIRRLEQRLVDTERGQLRARRAQQQAAKLLNQQLAGQQLPRAVVDFLLLDWYRELQWHLLQSGEHSESWRRCGALTAKLIASLQPPGDDAGERQALYALIPEVGAELRELLGARAHDQSQLERQLALIEQQHMLLLRGRLPDYAPFSLIANSDPWLSDITMSSELLARVNDLGPGQWFLYREAPLEHRIRLILKMDDTAQLLFVNRLGVKTLQQSFEEFAYLLATGAASPLPGAPIAAQLLRLLLQQLVRRDTEQSQARADARQRTDAQARRRVEARAKAITEAKVLAETQAQIAAAARAQADIEAARLIDAAKQQREDSAQQARALEQARRRDLLQQQAGDAEQRQRAARQSTAQLPIGSWVELHDELGHSQRLKLAVKLPSSGKMIFVDREGIRRAELVNDIFSARLLDGSARILDRGLQFEDTLARVVEGLRRDRADKE